MFQMSENVKKVRMKTKLKIREGEKYGNLLHLDMLCQKIRQTYSQQDN